MARAFLLIADIGGYTRFMSVHRVNLAHAQDVVAQLLESVIDGAGRALGLAQLEGDDERRRLDRGAGRGRVAGVVGVDATDHQATEVAGDKRRDDRNRK